MSGHTPGPWVHDGKCGVFDERKRDPICNTDYCCQQEDKANANLIAAAPDLLGALESALTILTDSVGDFDYDKALSAIARAKGEA